jgi:NIMA (never in mitosis gene a)-related kinase 2
MENYTVINENFGQGNYYTWPSSILILGSYGKVSLVTHRASGAEMVWKQTNYGGMNEKEKQQLINEVNILRELKHENIVRCYDKFVDKKHTSIYLVMEVCKGGDLS